MQVVRENDWFKVARVTGPTHNYLELLLRTDKQIDNPEVNILPANGSSPDLNVAKVLEAVRRGLKEANSKFASAFSVEALKFVRNDSGPEEIYSSLAATIIAEAQRICESAAPTNKTTKS